MMSTRNSEILGEYLAECKELLVRLGSLVGRVERDGLDPETSRAIGRDVHTLKGSSQLFGFAQIAQVADAIETFMAGSAGRTPATAATADKLFAALDLVEKLVSSVAQSTGEMPLNDLVQQVVASFAEPWPPIGVQQDVVKAAPALPTISRPPTIQNTEVPRTVDESLSDTIRVQVGILDELMTAVGELVLIKNQLQQSAPRFDDDDINRTSQRLNVVTAELQEAVMKTRMQPIGNALTKFHRVVRDTARELGKVIELRLEGTDTELDKTLIEAVKDPLTHIVRNAIDHGLETPEERRAAGKSEGGHIGVNAFHESGQIVIEISDDGRGLDRGRIAAKAVEKGLVSAEAVAQLADRDVHQFIFLPGFSTADKVSALSGRGVGMDVVRTNIERIGGTVDLVSRAGHGTTIRLKIPLTLAIIPALIVRQRGQRFAIPQAKLVELLRLDLDDEGGGRIDDLQGSKVYRLRGRILPLVDFGGLMEADTATAAPTSGVVNIAVLNSDRATFGLIVQAIDDSADIVVKPLAAFFKELGLYSGATILGDGAVALTLDVNGIAERAGLMSDATAETVRAGSSRASEAVEMVDYLLVDLDGRSRFALPLCLVSRLEEFEANAIQIAGDWRVVKYREALLPVISVANLLGLPPADKEKPEAAPRSSVVVVKKGEQHFGLEVGTILDVLATAGPIDASICDRAGLLGTLIDGNDIVVVIDALAVIDQALGLNVTRQAKAETGDDLRSRRAKHRVLVVDDAVFFRSQIGRALREAGYEVCCENDGQKALARLEATDAPIAAIVSDIEMPLMDGLELARRVRGNPILAKLPLLALTSSFTPVNRERGLTAGFDQYLAKLDVGAFVAEIDRLLSITKGLSRHAG